MHTIPNRKTQSRLLAAVTRDVLTRHTFATMVDLKAAVERHCRRLQVPCPAPALEIALDLIASNRGLLRSVPPQTHPVPLEATPIRHVEAVSVLDALGVRVLDGRLRPDRPSPSSKAPQHFPRLMEA